jgi:dephospho-CoA kinase
MTGPRVLGITGGIATGKSAVMEILGGLGAETIDADLVYHHLIGPGGALVATLAAAFGEQVIAADGSIDRRQLSTMVFDDSDALARLDALTHPTVAARIRAQIGTSQAAVVAVDAVKLIESGLANDCHAVWLIVSDRNVQRQRLMDRNQLTADQAGLRLDAQPDFAVAREIASEIIDNSGDRVALEQAVRAAWDRFTTQGQA